MPKKPVSKTAGRRNEDIKRELIAIIGGMKDPGLQGGMLTVTRVEAAPDLSTAKVYISTMGRTEGTGAVVEALNRAKGHVRSEIATRMRQLRRAPEFTFVQDDNAAYAAHINNLLKGLDK
ncbi:30S ribosome-binding factor RbfA [Ruminococcaceae bacterium OttesenSCG-928-A16]|nr:30S ribosome-binding factor RbfA [Ruminococcaceae bacterium OttesenSCG-928-A16]